MRITPSLLNKIARDTVEQRKRHDHNLLAVYLTGSLFAGNPLFGGTADIDLFFIHNERVSPEREIQRLTDEVHLDITHHGRDDYNQARTLRLHPWLGYNIINCTIMFDPQHFMNFTQASVRGQFEQPEYVLGRVQGQAELARQIWLSLHDQKGEPQLDQVIQYLRAVGQAANAVACLSGPPLTERRFLRNFPDRAAVVGRSGMYAGLLGLLGGVQANEESLEAWIEAWERAYLAIPAEQAPAHLHPDRFSYYRRAFASHIGGDSPQDVLWPLLGTWIEAVSLLPEDAPPVAEWQEAFSALGLLGPGYRERVAALDAYLDSVEELLDEWGQRRGIERETL
ncbi:MAG: hypothetical protein WA997_06350 [Anaerolineales bacterium]